MAQQDLFAIVKNRSMAEKMIKSLIEAGVNSEDISVLSSKREEFQDFISPSTEYTRNWRTEKRVIDFPRFSKDKKDLDLIPSHEKFTTEKHTKAPEGATTGAATGGIIGGVLGLLVGIGAIALPGIGPMIAAGPLMSVLSGIGAGGTLGGIIGALVGAGIPEYEAKMYEAKLQEGSVLISIHTHDDEQAKKWKNLLLNLGAEDVSLSSKTSATENRNKR